MEAYLDNSATTRVDAQVQELMKKLMDVDFGNPSSRHQKGVVAEGYIKDICAVSHDHFLPFRYSATPIWIVYASLS